jgi:hypothetical protein
MMGERRVRQEALFYGLSLERHVPSDYLLRDRDGDRRVLQRKRSRSPRSRNPRVLGVNATWRRSSDSNPLSQATP